MSAEVSETGKSKEFRDRIKEFLDDYDQNVKDQHSSSQYIHPTWKDLRDRSLRASRWQLALFFTKLESIFTPVNSAEDCSDGSKENCWRDAGLQLYDSKRNEEAHVCFILGGCGIQLVQYFFDQRIHRTAIELCLHQQRFDVILNFAEELNKNQNCDRYWYYTQLIQRILQTRHKSSQTEVVIALFFVIQELFPTPSEEGARLLVAVLRTFPQEILNPWSGGAIHEFLLNHYTETSCIRALGAFHFFLDQLESGQYPTREKLLEDKLKSFHDLWNKNLRRSLEKSDFELFMNVMELMTKKHLEAAEEVLAERTLNQNIEAFSEPEKTLLHVLRGTIRKYQGDIVGALDDYQIALTSMPLSSIPELLGKLFQDEDFHCQIITLVDKEFALISGIIRQRNFLHTPQTQPVTISRVFGMSTMPPEKATDDVTSRYPYVRVILKSEAAIQKMGKDDPLEAALAYINLCMSLSDPGSLLGAYLMAMNHFLEAMKNAASDNKPALVYSYHRIIFDMAAELYFGGRCSWTPLLQCYKDLSLFNILTSATEKLVTCVHRADRSEERQQQSKILSKKSMPAIETIHIGLIESLLVEWMRLSKLSPLCFLRPRVAFDTLVLDIVGLKFLKSFFRGKLARIKHSKLLPRSLFAYYQMQGVFCHWLDHLEFDVARYVAMASLLEEAGLNDRDAEDAAQFKVLLRRDGDAPAKLSNLTESHSVLFMVLKSTWQQEKSNSCFRTLVCLQWMTLSRCSRMGSLLLHSL